MYTTRCLIFILARQQGAPLTDKIQVETTSHGQTIQAGGKKTFTRASKSRSTWVHYIEFTITWGGILIVSTIPRHAHPSKSPDFPPV